MRATALEDRCKSDGRIGVVENEGVDERDLITVYDAANGEVIWKKDYYSFRVDAVFGTVLAYFAKKSAE